MKSRSYVLLLVLSLTLANSSYSQKEWFINVDPTTGEWSDINIINTVYWITVSPNYCTFDDNNHRYFFLGGDSLNNFFLFSIDAPTGNVIASPSFPVPDDPLDNVIELEYDNSSNTLYALHWDSSEYREYFGTVDPITGNFTSIDSLPGVTWISPGYTTFDDNNQRYIFRGGNSGGDWYLYSIDAETGDILNNPIFPVLEEPFDNVIETKYDNSSNTLFGLHWDNSEQREYFVSISLEDGSFTKIDSIPGVDWISTMVFTTVDEVNQRYIFRGGDSEGNWYLYSIDLSTGDILTSPLFPVLDDPADNVIQLEYDNSGDECYGLHWDANYIVSVPTLNVNENHFSITPNPFSETTQLILDRTYGEIVVFIYDETGKMCRKIISTDVSSVGIERSDLNSGVYFVSVVCDHVQIGMLRVLVQ